MLNALVPGVHWKVTYFSKPASESIKGLDLWEKLQINPRNVSNPRGAKNDFNHSKIDFTVQESVFTYWNLLERFLSAKWVIWSCAQITLMNTSERIHSTVKFILLTKTTILVLTEWWVSSRSCCSHLTISPRPRFIITHGAHCPGKSLKRPGFSKLSWIVLYFRKNTLTCPWLSWIFFHLLSVSTFQCTVLIWYDLMMIIIVMVNDSNFFNTWSPNNLCIVQSFIEFRKMK